MKKDILGGLVTLVAVFLSTAWGGLVFWLGRGAHEPAGLSPWHFLLRPCDLVTLSAPTTGSCHQAHLSAGTELGQFWVSKEQYQLDSALLISPHSVFCVLLGFCLSCPPVVTFHQTFIRIYRITLMKDPRILNLKRFFINTKRHPN